MKNKALSSHIIVGFFIICTTTNLLAQVSIKSFPNTPISPCEESTSFEFLITNTGPNTIYNQEFDLKLSTGISLNILKSNLPRGIEYLSNKLVINKIKPCEEFTIRLFTETKSCISLDEICIKVFWANDQYEMCKVVSKNEIVIEKLEVKSLGNKQFVRKYSIVNTGNHALSQVKIRYSASNDYTTIMHRVEGTNDDELFLRADQFKKVGNKNNVFDPNESLEIEHLYDLRDCKLTQIDTIVLNYACTSKSNCTSDYKYDHEIFSSANLDANSIWILQNDLEKSNGCDQYVMSLSVFSRGFIDYLRDLSFSISSDILDIKPIIDSVVFDKSKVSIRPNASNLIDLSGTSVTGDNFSVGDQDGRFNDLYLDDTIKLKLYFSQPADRDSLSIRAFVSFKNSCGTQVTRSTFGGTLFTKKPNITFSSMNSEGQNYNRFFEPNRLDVYGKDSFYMNFKLPDVSKLSSCEDYSIQVKIKVPQFVNTDGAKVYKNSGIPIIGFLARSQELDSLLRARDSALLRFTKIENVPFTFSGDTLILQIDSIQDFTKNYTIMFKVASKPLRDTCQICEQEKGQSFEFFTTFNCIGGKCFDKKTSYSIFNNFYAYKDEEDRITDIGTSLRISKSFTKVDKPIFEDRHGMIPSKFGENNFILENEKFYEYVLFEGKSNCQPETKDTFRINYWYSEKDIYFQNFDTKLKVTIKKKNGQVFQDEIVAFNRKTPQFSKYDLTSDVQIYSYDFTDIIRKYSFISGDSMWFERSLTRSSTLKTEYFGGHEVEITTPECTKTYGNKVFYPFSFLKPIMEFSLFQNPTHLYNSLPTRAILDANLFLSNSKNKTIGYRAVTKVDSIVLKYKNSDLRVSDSIRFDQKKFLIQKRLVGDSVVCVISGFNVDEDYTNTGKGYFDIQYTHLENQNQMMLAYFYYKIKSPTQENSNFENYLEVKTINLRAAQVSYEIKDKNQLIIKDKKQTWPIIINNQTYQEANSFIRGSFYLPVVWVLVERPSNTIDFALYDKSTDSTYTPIKSNSDFILYQIKGVGGIRSLELLAKTHNCLPYSFNVYTGATLDAKNDYFDYYIQNKERALGKFRLSARLPIPSIFGKSVPFSASQNCLGGNYTNTLFNTGADTINFRGLHINNLSNINYSNLSLRKNSINIPFIVSGDSILLLQPIKIIKDIDSLEVSGKFEIICDTDPVKLLRISFLSLTPCDNLIASFLSEDTLFKKSINENLITNLDVELKELKNINGIRSLQLKLTPKQLVKKGTRLTLDSEIRNIKFTKTEGLMIAFDKDKTYLVFENDTRDVLYVHFDIESDEKCGNQCDTLYWETSELSLAALQCNTSCQILQSTKPIRLPIPSSSQLKRYSNHNFAYKNGEIIYKGVHNMNLMYEDSFQIEVIYANPIRDGLNLNPIIASSKSLAIPENNNIINATFKVPILLPCLYLVKLTSRYGCDTIISELNVEADTLFFTLCANDTLTVDISNQKYDQSVWTDLPSVLDRKTGFMRYYNPNLLSPITINSLHTRPSGCTVQIPITIYPLKNWIDFNLKTYDTFECTDSAKTFLAIGQLDSFKTILVNNVIIKDKKDIYLNSGTNDIKLTTKNGCEIATSLYITTPEKPKINLLNFTSQICKEKSGILDFFVLSAQNYAITINADTVFQTKYTDLNPGKYFIKAQNISNCIDTLSVNIQNSIKPILESNLINIYCGESVLLTKSLKWVTDPKPNLFSLDGLNFKADSLSLTPSIVNYNLISQSSENCRDTFAIRVNIVPVFQAQIQKNYEVRKGESINLQLTNGDSFIKFNWFGSYELDCDTCKSTNVVIDKSGTVIGRFYDLNNCLDTALLVITTLTPYKLILPNILRKNAPPPNDRLTIDLDPAIGVISSFEIYDRYGNKIYGVKDTRKVDWPAICGDQLCMDGVYTYRMEVIVDEKKESFYGSITVL